MAEKRGRGRPPVPESERLSNFVVRLSPVHRAYVEWRASVEDATASDVVRRLIDVAIDAERPLLMTAGHFAESDVVLDGVMPGDRYPVRRLMSLLSLADWDNPLPEDAGS